MSETQQFFKAPELRSTPGFTNYVISNRKKLGGAVSSAELKRYYSAIDAEIYIDGDWFEDCQAIDWDIQSPKTPLYGFASYVWDDVAFGTRIIQGSFTINFTKPDALDGYIKNQYSTTDGKNTTENYEEANKKKPVEFNINGTMLKKNAVHQALWNIPFDIDIVCGETEMAGKNPPVHIVLTQCYILDSRSIRGKDGGVAAEVYSFIARDYQTIGL